MSSPRFLRLGSLAALLAAACLLTPADAIIGKKNWDKVDWTKAEKDLEDGDDPALLVSEDAALLKEFEDRKKVPLQPPSDAGLKDPTEWVKHQQSMSGPAMFFCTLKPVNPKTGLAWDEESLKMIAYEWRELLKTAGIEAQAYDIADAASKARGEAARLLVTTQTGWKGYDVRDFLLRQPELDEAEWDQVKYTAADLEAIEATKGRAPAGGGFSGGFAMPELPPGVPPPPGFGVPGGGAAPSKPKAKPKAKAKAKPKAKKEEEL